MTKEEYSKLLRTEEWNVKRLAILKRDGYCCQHCAAVDRELHVHHLYYRGNNKPWEYPDEALITLCKPCHRKEHLKEKKPKAVKTKKKVKKPNNNKKKKIVKLNKRDQALQDRYNKLKLKNI